MYFIAKIGAAGAVGFASTTGASAQALNANFGPDDLLSIQEAPLSETELKKARGGFKFGGFDFNFGIDIQPVDIAPLDMQNPSQDGGMFGPDGVFGEDGVFGDNGSPIGDDGVFGSDGVFGDGGGPSSNAANNAPLPIQTANNAVQNSNAPSVNTPQPVTTSAPQTPSVQNNAPAPSTTPVVQNTAPAPSTTPVVQNTAPAPSSTTPVVQNTAPSMPSASPQTTPTQTAALPSSPSTAPAANNSGPVEQLAGPAQNTAVSPPSTSSANPVSNGAVANTASAPKTSDAPDVSMSTKMTGGATISRVIQQVGANGHTLIIDNNLNNVRLTQVVNLDVQVLNFDSRINRAIADSVLATLASRNHILNSVRN